MGNKFDVLSTRAARLDAPAKATGQAVYVDDMNMTGQLYGAILQSPLAHARILNIDTSKAEGLPGVKSVITAKNVGLVRYGVSPARWMPAVVMSKMRQVLSVSTGATSGRTGANSAAT